MRWHSLNKPCNSPDFRELRRGQNFHIDISSRVWSCSSLYSAIFKRKGIDVGVHHTGLSDFNSYNRLVLCCQMDNFSAFFTRNSAGFIFPKFIDIFTIWTNPTVHLDFDYIRGFTFKSARSKFYIRILAFFHLLVNTLSWNPQLFSDFSYAIRFAHVLSL